MLFALLNALSLGIPFGILKVLWSIDLNTRLDCCAGNYVGFYTDAVSKRSELLQRFPLLGMRFG